MEHPIRYFGLANVSLDNDLARIEREKSIQIRSKRRDKGEDSYYPQVPAQIRRDAKSMSEHYELFYCLESSIRDLIRTTIEAAEPIDWWQKLVPL